MKFFISDEGFHPICSQNPRPPLIQVDERIIKWSITLKALYHRDITHTRKQEGRSVYCWHDEWKSISNLPSTFPKSHLRGTQESHISHKFKHELLSSLFFQYREALETVSLPPCRCRVQNCVSEFWLGTWPLAGFTIQWNKCHNLLQYHPQALNVSNRYRQSVPMKLHEVLVIHADSLCAYNIFNEEGCSIITIARCNYCDRDRRHFSSRSIPSI